ncbi:hypothetical protein GCM10007923_13400 [Shinella yambaruensis]|uniref:Protein GrpE n=2 Tax=Shinella yambaruensis TaxID=415996 RepID=A0ABQ5ZER7_9HYPH|nr:hypothetical protein GCM10007923_13400 [Shinella yambaruensis]
MKSEEQIMSKPATPNDVETETPREEPGEAAVEAVVRLEAEVADLKDRLLRALAETENLRRRAERDVSDARQYAVSKFAADLVGVADNLERALASVPAEARRGSAVLKTLSDGVALTGKDLMQVFEKHGIRRIEPLGERFDPHLHEALFEVADPSVPSGTVSTVVSPGYAIGSRPLRAAKVGVARGGPAAAADGG